MWKVFTRQICATDFLGLKSPKTGKFAIFFASETNTFHISYVESKNEFKAKKIWLSRGVAGIAGVARYLSHLKGYKFDISDLVVIWAGLMHLILRILKF
jgi:hypothetical protein